MTKRKPIEVDIGAAYATLQASPELCAAMNELVGGPALIEAQAEIARLTALIANIGLIALAGFKGEMDEDQALCDINNLIRDELNPRNDGPSPT